MQLTNLTLTNFRSYRQLDLALEPGLTVISGENGQGKSNLLEAVYLLAIGKSYRAVAERDVVSWPAAEAGAYAIVAATFEGPHGPLELRVGLDCRDGTGIVKHVRVNGAPKRASDLVGMMGAALFAAEDIDLVFGAPRGRRRYLDVLLAQVSRSYVRTLSRYQRVLAQRNTLLRALRERRAHEQEMAFWDDALVKEGAALLEERWSSMGSLGQHAAAAFERLSSQDTLSVAYVGTAEGPEDGDAAGALREALRASRDQERARGMTLVGPHRDDLRLLLNGVEAPRHASRGQARLAALALRLGEARLLAERRGDPPVLLLDDALSELDERRRILVLEEACCYPQAIVTTADPNVLPEAFLHRAHRMRTHGGEVLKEEAA
ncbi:MAG: DNA replication and repair protein RecF [Chloroflexota bacterium]|nr:DNA replication and repair protein RecF [Chloroflexota bacterium]MDE2884229.1 DNA replication and repair protein RecF [Chloroflexota bacterium]